MEYQPPVGYVLKQAQSLLRLRMEEALAPVQLTVSQYSCLHLLRREPGASAAALARGTFVTRQSMNAMLQLLLDRGLVQRPDTADNGRALPATLTTAGADVLAAAQARVDEVESRMLSGLEQPDRNALLRTLTACVNALE
ncbi:MAG: MarR family transcriptional regulator [Actinomycetota bacterium]